MKLFVSKRRVARLLIGSCLLFAGVVAGAFQQHSKGFKPLNVGKGSCTTRTSSNFSTDDHREFHRILVGKFLPSFFSAVIVVSTSLLGVTDASAATSQFPSGQKYWSIMSNGQTNERAEANEALLDYAVGTVNTQFYDNTGGAFFTPREFYSHWKLFKRVANGEQDPPSVRDLQQSAFVVPFPTDVHLDSRAGAVEGLKWLVGSLNDPFSKYLTREELKAELQGDTSGFLGTGAVVEPPRKPSSNKEFAAFFGPEQISSSSLADSQRDWDSTKKQASQKNKKCLTSTRVANLPVITAVAPDSSAERLGLVVGDRIVAVGNDSFLGWTRSQVEKALHTKYNQQNYFGEADLTIAKPVYVVSTNSLSEKKDRVDEQPIFASLDTPTLRSHEVVLGYRSTRVRMATTSSSNAIGNPQSSFQAEERVFGGGAAVHYELLTSSSGSIFDHLYSENAPTDAYRVGYIRLTRFSKTSTAGYVEAVRALEKAGAKSYILDLRNNYGGVIQEAMLTASTLLRDPHAILCYTMNAKGGFTPHDAEEYIVDKRYPGYFLSSESEKATIDQVQKENPAMFVDNGIAWDPPSSFASLHEQVTKRGIRRIGYVGDISALLANDPLLNSQLRAQKKIVVLINEGTASAAEVFAAALHDNARAVALLGTKTYGKGLIQHTFPMPDGGGLRLTVAEYLTPQLRHVTKVGGARFDRQTGELVGGGIQPDIVCESKQGIPRNIRADLCVGMALDALDEAQESLGDGQPNIANHNGMPSQVIGSNQRKR